MEKQTHERVYIDDGVIHLFAIWLLDTFNHHICANANDQTIAGPNDCDYDHATFDVSSSSHCDTEL